MQKTIKAPAFATGGSINLRLGFKEGKCWLDDISVYSLEDRIDLMENGSFEKLR